jgi:hypothetical protein
MMERLNRRPDCRTNNEGLDLPTNKPANGSSIAVASGPNTQPQRVDPFRCKP